MSPLPAEFLLIDSFFRKIKRAGLDGGLGDDCAIIKAGAYNFAVSIDSFAEGTHFNKDFPLEAVGFRSVVAAASDVSAMGIRPEDIFVSLALKKKSFYEDASSIYSGILSACKKWKIKIAGGDVISSKKTFISICATGKAKKFVTRSGARPGDIVFVKGFEGLAAAGLECLKKKIRNEEFLKALFYPQLKIDFAKKAAVFANSLIDSSDGLAPSLFFISQMSGVKIEAESRKIPVKDSLIKFCGSFEKALKLVLWGGEDYNLIGTASPQNFGKIKEASIIGTVSKGKGFFIDGKEIPWEGFKHF